MFFLIIMVVIVMIIFFINFIEMDCYNSNFIDYSENTRIALKQIIRRTNEKKSLINDFGITVKDSALDESRFAAKRQCSVNLKSTGKLKQVKYLLNTILYPPIGNIYCNIASFFNSRTTHVQPPTVTLVVQNKRKRTKTCFTTDLNFFNVKTFISFCDQRLFDFFLHISRSIFFYFYAMIMFIAHLFLLFS